MSGKSRYGGGFGSGHYASDTAAEETRNAAATTAGAVATDAAVQASWAQYVQNLVSEQIAAVHDGVIDGFSEVINEQLNRCSMRPANFSIANWTATRRSWKRR
jgi:hypothetical protein